MKTVLIVDDEKNFLLSLSEGLAEYADEFETCLAFDGREALELLEHRPVDLVVTDLRMPRMDGFSLLAEMSVRHPDLPAIVMTAYATPEIRRRLNACGAVCLDKPVEFSNLVDTILAALSASSDGHLKGIPLPTFLQLVEMEKKTCTLRVRSEGGEGVLYFRRGELLDAEAPGVSGEDAVYEIVGWDRVEIEIDAICRRSEKRIHNDLTAVMLEGLRRKDERAAGTKGDGPAVRETSAHSNPKTEDAMNSIKEILNTFMSVGGVTAACLVGRDGFLLESVARADIDTEMIGAIASSGFGAAESMGSQLAKGTLRMNMLEFDFGPVVLSPVGSDGFIVIVADQNANIGMIRLQLKRNAAQLAAGVGVPA